MPAEASPARRGHMAADADTEAAAVKAISATGPMIRVEPPDFTLLVYRMEAPLVVTAQMGVFRTYHRYLTAYKGMFFYTNSPGQLRFGAQVELVAAKTIRIPL